VSVVARVANVQLSASKKDETSTSCLLLTKLIWQTTKRKL